MKDRIKTVRKELGLTQKEFAAKINLSENFILYVEKGTRTPSDRTISDICRTFNINEDWLRNGTGTMYVPETEDEELAKFFAEVLSDEPDSIRRRWASAFSKLSLRQWENLADIADTLSKK